MRYAQAVTDERARNTGKNKSHLRRITALGRPAGHHDPYASVRGRKHAMWTRARANHRASLP